MPELPDIEVYLAALRERLGGKRIERVRLGSPFVLRTVDPPLRALEGRRIEGFRRLGKRIVFELGEDWFLVVHLMIAGRFRYERAGTALPRKHGLLALDVDDASLLLTEAGTQRRASVHVLTGDAALAALDPGGLEVLTAGPEAFAAALRRRNHTLKRALTDPRILSGIGNAYSDEILHRARLSPVTWTSRLDDDELGRLYQACRGVLTEWTARLETRRRGGFPKKVTAFVEGMAVHGRYRQPCPVCGAPVQRIVRASNEINYCAPCQTGGKLLADRALSRLLQGDWPRSLEELDELKQRAKDALAGGNEG